MSILSIDVESRSAADLRKTGAARYFEDPSADVLCAAFAIGENPVSTWVRGQPCPDVIVSHVKAGLPIAAWNATFEAWAWKYVLGPKHGWPVPALTQWVDTMAQAAAMSIPQSLDGAAQALAMEQQKDKDGMRLIRKFSIPRKAKKGEAPGRLYWTHPEDAPDDFAAFVAYCAQDVEVERAIRKKLVPLSDYEQRVWALTLQTNDRGVHLDMPLVDALQRVAEQAKARLDKEMLQATGGAVTACSQVAALTRWLEKETGLEIAGLAKNDLSDMLAMSHIVGNAREALELRKEAAKTSTAKLDAMQAAVCRDDRARGLHLYHGAGTGRWSGRLIQTQNMPRGTGTVKEPEDAVDDMLTGDARWIDMIYGQPMSAVSDMLRSCITASPGNRLLAADYSSIEGRVTAWLAGEQDEIDAYRANDAGTGAGIYEIAAGGIFNVDPFKVTKPQRQVGKAASLALGFGGGVLAFNSMASIYGIDMTPVYPILRGTSDPETFERAAKRYEECLERGDTGTDLMGREAWIASEVTKVLWRGKHPNTVELWRGLEDAAREAVSEPGAIATYGKISYTVRRGFLWCRLPSGRCLAYGSPRIEDRKTPWGDLKPSVTALGVDSITKRWSRSALYGGLLTENCLSGLSEVLTDNGWQRIDTVDTYTSVWDGQEFVSHSGLLAQGVKETICFGGLWLTPDHKVLTTDGWKHARDAEPREAASPRTELAWPAIWSVGGAGLCGIERRQEPVVDEVRLWDCSDNPGDGLTEGLDEELRLPTRGGPSQDPRYVEAPSLCGLALNAGQVPPADAPSLAKLRGTWNPGVRPLGEFRELLGRHGSDVCVRLDAGQRGQQRKLRTRELPLGSAQNQLSQQADKRDHRDPGGADATVRSRREKRAGQDDAVLPGESRLASGPDVRPTGLPEPRLEPVYDLLNCGPRHRFVARGGPGQRPFIVHNCVQAVARDLMAHGMLLAEEAGYPMVMTVHDEGVADVPLGFGSLAEFEALLCSSPSWATGLPVVASGWEGLRYRKD